MSNMANNTKNGNQIVKGTLYKTCKYTMKTLWTQPSSSWTLLNIASKPGTKNPIQLDEWWSLNQIR